MLTYFGLICLLGLPVKCCWGLLRLLFSFKVSSKSSVKEAFHLISLLWLCSTQVNFFVFVLNKWAFKYVIFVFWRGGGPDYVAQPGFKHIPPASASRVVVWTIISTSAQTVLMLLPSLSQTLRYTWDIKYGLGHKPSHMGPPPPHPIFSSPFWNCQGGLTGKCCFLDPHRWSLHSHWSLPLSSPTS